VIAAGWALVAGDDNGWHAFTVTQVDQPVRSRCAQVTVAVDVVEAITATPQGRPCLDCLLVVTADLPDPGGMGQAL
jgi:hypothetical protein